MSPETCAYQFEAHYTREPRNWMRLLGTPLPYGRKSLLNPDSLQGLTCCKVEPSLKDATPGSRYQFERQGYFCVDPDTAEGKLVFNGTVPLRDTWAKIEKAQRA